MQTPEKKDLQLGIEVERLRLKANLKEKLLGRALHDSEILSEKLARKQEELREINSQLGRAKELLKQSFQRFVSHHIVEEILQTCEPVNLRGERKTVTILVSDIRGFTALSEQFEPEELVSFLNTYLSEMIEVIFDNEGTLDKFMGDAILALFGAPLSLGDDALRAVRTAIAMQDKLRELNRTWKTEGKPKLKIGIGISTGEVVVGNIGSEKRMEYTVIGQDVNYATRIETLTKELSCDILVAESTYEKVKDFVLAEKFGPIPIRGSNVRMNVYGIRGLKQTVAR
jgi:adenylate cyclase